MSTPDKLSLQLQELYSHRCPDCGGFVDIETLSISETEYNALQSAFNKLARWIFKTKKSSVVPEDLRESTVQPLINETRKVLNDAVRRGIEYSIPSDMQRYLRKNVHIFSGLKTFRELKEVSALLMDGDEVKPFSKFWQDVQKIHKDYNRNYLKSEYIFATQSAQMASKWAEYEKDGDRYNLQYRTAGDDRVREEHRVLHNTTLPASDPFWDEYYPPNGWRCRCTAVQVRKSKYPESNSAQARKLGAEATEGKKKLFRFNPGKERRIFPDKHPYFPKNGCAGCDLQKLSYKTPDDEKCRACRILQETQKHKEETWETIPTDNGKVSVSSLHGKNEKEENVEIASYFANKYGHEIELLARNNEEKSADVYNKTLNIIQEYKRNHKASYSSIDSALRRGKNQADHIVIDIVSKIKLSVLADAINARTKYSKNIKSVCIKKGNFDKRYERDEIVANDFCKRFYEDFKIQWD